MTEKELDEKFDEILKEAGKLAIEKMEKETLEELDKLPEVEFSERHEKRMKNIFKMARKNIKK